MSWWSCFLSSKKKYLKHIFIDILNMNKTYNQIEWFFSSSKFKIQEVKNKNFLITIISSIDWRKEGVTNRSYKCYCMKTHNTLFFLYLSSRCRPDHNLSKSFLLFLILLFIILRVFIYVLITLLIIIKLISLFFIRLFFVNFKRKMKKKCL